MNPLRDGNLVKHIGRLLFCSWRLNGRDVRVGQQQFRLIWVRKEEYSCEVVDNWNTGLRKRFLLSSAPRASLATAANNSREIE